MKVSTFFKLLRDNLRVPNYKLVKYLINDGKKHPFAIICPGGAYNMVASFVEGEPFALELNKRGYNAFVLYYRTGVKAHYPNPQEDLKKAVKDIFDHKEEYGVDTSNWSLWGSSAGGHLVASYCLDKENVKPNALVLVYPVITMGEHTHRVSKLRLLGRNPSEEMVKKMSIELNITKDFPKTYIWNGTADKCVEPINAELMENALKNANVKYRRDVYENVGHGVGLGEKTAAEGWFNNAFEFINN